MENFGSHSPGLYHVVLMTAPDLEVARRLARAALENKLVACVNLVPHVESLYWWEGKIDSSAEVVLIAKTVLAKLPALEAFVRQNHPYDTPEFVVLPLHGGSSKYLAWIGQSIDGQ